MSWASKQSERIAIYVDGANAYFAQKEALGWWIDWDAFLGAMQDDKELVSARWYQAYRATPESEQDRFLHHLTLMGFAVRKKIVQATYDHVSGQNVMKGSLDIELTIDALTESSHFDTAILVSGDGIFVPLVEALKARGKRVLIVSTDENVAVELRQAVGVNYIDFLDLRDQIESDKIMESSPIESRPSRSIAPTREPAITPRKAPQPPMRAAAATEGGSQDDDFEAESLPDPESIDLPVEGESIRCRVQAVKKYGVFLDLHQHAKTLLHVKDMNRGFVPDAGELYQVGEEIMVKVISIDRKVNPPEVRVTVVAPETEY
ncbi:MAG TPA: NYN domain-containing protein [Candidatus Krumholzibacteria bacterium]|jgi:uncharacterized LabA/DUF88 family protein